MENIVERSTFSVFYEVFKDPDRKPLLKIFYELFYLLFIFKELPVHYFSRFLFKKEITDVKKYVPNKLTDKIALNFNDQTVKDVLDNKLFFDYFYARFNISLPKILMYNFKNIFVIGSRRIEVNSVQDFKVLLEDIFRQPPPL